MDPGAALLGGIYSRVSSNDGAGRSSLQLSFYPHTWKNIPTSDMGRNSKIPETFSWLTYLSPESKKLNHQLITNCVNSLGTICLLLEIPFCSLGEESFLCCATGSLPLAESSQTFLSWNWSLHINATWQFRTTDLDVVSHLYYLIQHSISQCNWTGQ